MQDLQSGVRDLCRISSLHTVSLAGTLEAFRLSHRAGNARNEFLYGTVFLYGQRKESSKCGKMEVLFQS